MSAAVPIVAQHAWSVRTRGRGFTEIGGALGRFVATTGVSMGVVNLWCHHTSCSLIAGENADPAVRADLERYFARLVRDGDPLFEHDAEGPDDMPAHVRSVLTATSLTVPVRDAQLALGTWQGIFLWEHRTNAHERRLTATVFGNPA
ncbi:MAG TPA: secondary thiamine-phosphate synthase enzyme YjbQ [Candidatus Saccharimonadia bacterium]|nr:secondary thiamine-phosphate synthase enzyme YjbQ [Candidatus Saccharimonadia bacterium]